MMKKIIILLCVAFLTSAFAAEKKPKYEVATFAAGCFWCIQPPFDKLKDKGVIETRVGYSGGDDKNVTYEEVGTGRTGHAESIEIKFDPNRISYEKLLEIFWDNIDPTDGNGQFVDQGPQYRPIIFFHDENQKKLATESKKKLTDSKKYAKPIAVTIEPYKFFVDAEEYHQEFYDKNPVRYEIYKTGSGRKSFFKKHNNP